MRGGGGIKNLEVKSLEKNLLFLKVSKENLSRKITSGIFDS